MHSSTQPSALMPLPEVARRLGVSVKTVHRLVKSGRLPVIRPTVRRVLVAQSDLDAYILACRALPQRGW